MWRTWLEVIDVSSIIWYSISMSTEQIYSVGMSYGPLPSESAAGRDDSTLGIEPYLPEQLGLDPKWPADQQLYRDSLGDTELAFALLERRKVAEDLALGLISREEADQGFFTLDWSYQNRLGEIMAAREGLQRH
jgi:hypothetical protein